MAIRAQRRRGRPLLTFDYCRARTMRTGSRRHFSVHSRLRGWQCPVIAPIFCGLGPAVSTITAMNLVVIPNSEERRRRPRVPVDMAVEALDDGPALHAHDIGIGGMLVSTTHPRWPGQHIRVRFTLPMGGRAIRTTCRVLELVEAPSGIGLSLQFLALASKAQLEILRFVSERLKTLRVIASENAAAAADAPTAAAPI